MASRWPVVGDLVEINEADDVELEGRTGLVVEPGPDERYGQITVEADGETYYMRADLRDFRVVVIQGGKCANMRAIWLASYSLTQTIPFNSTPSNTKNSTLIPTDIRMASSFIINQSPIFLIIKRFTHFNT